MGWRNRPLSGRKPAAAVNGTVSTPDSVYEHPIASQALFPGSLPSIKEDGKSLSTRAAGACAYVCVAREIYRAVLRGDQPISSWVFTTAELRDPSLHRNIYNDHQAYIPNAHHFQESFDIVRQNDSSTTDIQYVSIHSQYEARLVRCEGPYRDSKSFLGDVAAPRSGTAEYALNYEIALLSTKCRIRIQVFDVDLKLKVVFNPTDLDPLAVCSLNLDVVYDQSHFETKLTSGQTPA